jgi:gas vesicle protein
MLMTFLVGLGIGAVAALLFAPKSGEELQADIVDKANEGIDHVRRSGNQLKQRARNLADSARDQVQDAIDAGQTAYDRAAGKQ